MNIFEDIPVEFENEIISTLCENSSCRIEKILSNGQTSPNDFWYDQEESEWILLVQGEAKLLVEEKIETAKICENNKSTEIFMKAGDTYFIPKHKRHRVSYTSESPPCIWICVFMSINNFNN